MVNLRTITKENIEDILNLSVSEEHKGLIKEKFNPDRIYTGVARETVWPKDCMNLSGLLIQD